MSDILQMSQKELSRAQVLRQVDEGQITQTSAAEQLHLSTRQIKRLLKTYRRFGAQGLLSSEHHPE